VEICGHCDRQALLERCLAFWPRPYNRHNIVPYPTVYTQSFPFSNSRMLPQRETTNNIESEIFERNRGKHVAFTRFKGLSEDPCSHALPRAIQRPWRHLGPKERHGQLTLRACHVSQQTPLRNSTLHHLEQRRTSPLWTVQAANQMNLNIH
jgi:hypothetical protein